MKKGARRRPARRGVEVSSPVFFRSPEELRAWFAKHAKTARELWVGFHRVATGRPTITWSDAVDEALCVGWIDGIRKRLDDTRYANRFTPRNPRSAWSAINIAKVQALIREGRMQPAGLAAFEARRPERSGIYSYEQRPADLVEPYRGIFAKEKAAWAFYQSQPPGYRKLTTWWIVSAGKEETRLKRLQKLIEDSKAGRRLDALAPASGRSRETKRTGGRK
jgi:uncharacterized protein YdeI (YjbR/CyaY-like superfamily)